MNRDAQAAQASLAVDIPRPAWRSPPGRRRRSNRKVAVQRKPLLVWVAEGLTACGRLLLLGLRRLSLLAIVAALVGAVVIGGRAVVGYAVSSSHFAVRAVELSPMEHVPPAELLALAGVADGDRLLALDPDQIAARIATHPWIQSVKVTRKLPSTLAVDVTERRVAAAVNMTGLYLMDQDGVPFKRAEMGEARGLVVITGIERGEFLQQPTVAQAALRQALSLLRTYRAVSTRPELSEIHVDPRHGFSLFLREGGGEVRLGKRLLGEKLARLDEILEALPEPGPDVLRNLRMLYLDDDNSRRVSLRLNTDARAQRHGKTE